MPSPSSPRLRGSTLIELLIVVAVQFVILGAAASLYLFTVQQCGQATAAIGPLVQANAAMDAIALTVRESMNCTVQSAGSVTGLRCILPANAADGDGDGVNDLWMPTSFALDGKPKYAKGTRVWFYLGDATGAFGTVGTILWRATRADDNKPTTADADRAWSLYYAGAPRYALVDSISFTVSATSATTTVGLVASASARKPDASGATASAQDQQRVSLARTMSWRTDFE